MARMMEKVDLVPWADEGSSKLGLERWMAFIILKSSSPVCECVSTATLMPAVGGAALNVVDVAIDRRNGVCNSNCCLLDLLANEIVLETARGTFRRI